MEPTPATSQTTLRRGSLGPFAVAFFVISAAGPLVAMAGGVPVAMLFGNGAGLPALFAATTLLLLLFAVAYTAMAREVPNAGAFYAFAARGLGGATAAATGLIALLSYNALQIGLYGLFGLAMKGVVEPHAGISLPWWSYALAAMATIGGFGYRQVDLSAKVLGALVACEYLVVVVLDVSIVHSGGREGLSAVPFTPHEVFSGAPAIGLMLCLTAFVGFEATTIYSEEARDPVRTIPLATYFSVILIGAFYTVSSWAMVMGSGAAHFLEELRGFADPTELLFRLASTYVGTGLETAMRLLFVTSIYASLLAFHNSIARYFFAMGREYVLPTRLGAVHPRHASPHVGSATQSVVAFVAVLLLGLSGADPVLVVFTLNSAVATLGIILLMAISSLAALAHFSRADRRPTGVLVSAGVSFAAFVGIAAVATWHFDVLAGPGEGIHRWAPVVLPIAAALGVALAVRLRRADPHRYESMGRAQH